jgi:hypothetical protein
MRCLRAVALHASLAFALALGPLPRFAVCIVGQLRTLADEVQRHNVQRLLIDALPGGADVFTVFDANGSREAGNLAASKLHSVSNLFIQSPPYDIPDSCPWKPHPGGGAFHIQSYKIGQCFKAVQAREQEKVRARVANNFFFPRLTRPRRAACTSSSYARVPTLAFMRR